MNKKAYYRDLIQLQASLKSSDFRTLLDLANIFNDVHVTASNLNFRIFIASDQDSVVRQEKAKVNTAVKSAIAADKSKTKMRQLHRCAGAIERLFNKIATRHDTNFKINVLLNCLMDVLDTFLDDYESYRVTFEPRSVYSLSFTAHRLMLAVEALDQTIDTILENYLPEKPNDSSHLELYLSHVPSLKVFGTKLQVLDEMYIELCNLCNLSPTDNPIVIDHIENGSLLTRISGNPLVVGILLQVLGSSATYFIANYPVKHEMIEIKETTATLDEMFELSQKLRAAGYEVDDMQDGIHRSLKKLAGSAEKLLSDQPTIEVNEKIFELDAGNAQKLIEETKRLELKVYDQEA